MMQPIPRPEYPRPQLVRESWQNLNGTWQFEYDYGRSLKERRQFENGTFSREILVPFCPESVLSGIGNTDYIPAVWYRRTFTTAFDGTKSRMLLHFGAVDFHTEVWINGQAVGSHDGGYDSFTFEITDALKRGENEIVVYAEDDTRSGLQPKGKQSGTYYSRGCDYTRTTGIWQTVWLEEVPKTYIRQLKTTPDVANSALLIDAMVDGACDGERIYAEASFDKETAGEASCVITGGQARFTLPLSVLKLWDVGAGNLYDLRVSLESGDTVSSYFGMRSVSLQNGAICLNGRPVFQRLVLDQGFYPDGIYTAPSEEALERDIDLSMKLGFNGARLHQKVFEERFLYLADRKGYLVWGEHANWGLDITSAQGLEKFMPEWISIVNRDYNHPAIVGWCPFNETWDGANGAHQDDQVLRLIYLLTKQMDPFRPVIDTSGNYHVITDIYDVHDYEQDPEVLSAHYAPMAADPTVAYETFPKRQHWEGQPYFVSEFGGTWWSADTTGNNWGYGNRPTSEEEAIARITGLCSTLLVNPRICAFCYNQLYDVEQEQNGLYTYARGPKFSDEGYKAIVSALQQKAAIEK